MDWQVIITSIIGLGVFGDILAHLFLPYRRKEDRAKAARTEADTISILHDVMQTQAERVKAQNDIIDGKTDRIRELTDKAITSEFEKNELNAKLIRFTEDNAALKIELEHYKLWHCRKADCADRLPPRPELKGLKWHKPHG